MLEGINDWGESLLIARRQFIDRVARRISRWVCAVEYAQPVLAAEFGRQQINFGKLAQPVCASQEVFDALPLDLFAVKQLNAGDGFVLFEQLFARREALLKQAWFAGCRAAG